LTDGSDLVVVAMMRVCFRVIMHFVMRRVIRVHVLEFSMRAWAHPMTNATRVVLRAGGDEAAFSMMTVMLSMMVTITVRAAIF
jgi:hypothetical protein